jgi:hypothetical protein
VTDALSKLREFPGKLRKKAIASREEAGRIRRTVHVATDAESNCQVRAEVWDDVAAELQALLPALEQQLIQKWTEGFELAHELAKCGHARANYRDPNYKTSDAECDSSKCEFCEAIAALEQRERELIDRAIGAFDDAYCRVDDPLMGVIKGRKAMAELRAALNPTEAALFAPALEEAHNKITATLKPAGDLKPKPWTDEREAAHARELLKARLEEAKLQLHEHYCNSVICTCPRSKRIADLERQLAALPEEGK